MRSTTRHGDRSPLLPMRSSSCLTRKTPRGVPGHPVWVSRGGHRIGSSSAPWSSSPTSCPWCRFWTFLGRRRWTSWWRRAGTSICTSPSRSLKCPRSRLHPVVVAGAGFLWCRRRNSWWKCLRSYPTLLFCSGLSSRPSTFQFLMIVVAGAVEQAFKVSLKDRVQQRAVEQNSFTFQFQVLEGRVLVEFNCTGCGAER